MMTHPQGKHKQQCAEKYVNEEICELHVSEKNAHYEIENNTLISSFGKRVE